MVWSLQVLKTGANAMSWQISSWQDWWCHVSTNPPDKDLKRNCNSFLSIVLLFYLPLSKCPWPAYQDPWPAYQDPWLAYQEHPSPRGKQLLPLFSQLTTSQWKQQHGESTRPWKMCGPPKESKIWHQTAFEKKRNPHTLTSQFVLLHSALRICFRLCDIKQLNVNSPWGGSHLIR